ncbi:MAG TPA: hypothetical protein VFB66_13145 [Tepidisphaeraceae bacterium]|nr:hypothetical protein [Tepidisphaeraceae bacterium]
MRFRLVFSKVWRNRHLSPARASGGVVASTEALEPRRLLAASLLKDINTTPFGSDPATFAEVNGRLVFAAGGGNQGVALYGSDGTAAGTVKLHDVDATRNVFNDEMAVSGGVMFFVGYTAEHGKELWRTDGTAAGTFELDDINPGAADSGARWVVAGPGGAAYFIAFTAGEGYRIWRSDGTAAGTAVFHDPFPGPDDPARFLGQVMAVGDDVYFVTYGPDSTLWVTDGTAAGTRALRTFTGPFATPVEMTPLGDLLVFAAPHPDGAGREPWVTDGTPEGTRLLKDIRPGESSSNPRDFLRAGGHVYFSADDGVRGAELWRTDGTPDGTTLVQETAPGPEGFARPLAELGSAVFFQGLSTTRNALFRVGDATPLTTFVSGEGIYKAVAAGGTLFFTTSRGLWTSDGTAAGTALLAPLQVSTGRMARFGDGVAFNANDFLHGAEPWVSDGTAGGTRLLADINPRNAGSLPVQQNTPVAAPRPLSLGGRTIFAADGEGQFGALWSTDGTPDGTTRLSAFTPPFASQMVDLNGVAYTLGSVGFQPGWRELWRTDGTNEGTRRVLDTVFVAPEANPVVMNGHVYFVGDYRTGGRGWGLIRSDGTADGTTYVNIGPSPAPLNLTAAGDKLYFTRQAGAGNELWVTDGTNPAVKLRDFKANADGALRAQQLTDVNGTLFFRAEDPMRRGQLWKSDGTPQGTVMLRQFSDQISQASPTHYLPLVPAGGLVYFVAAPADRAGTDLELWRSDGTPGGTVLLKDINPGSAPSSPAWIVPTGSGRVFFAAGEPAAGRELWTSDGTEAGTRRVTDLYPGPGGSHPVPYGEFNGRVYFSADDGIRGREMWSTDGTAGGTTRVHDVNPGPPHGIGTTSQVFRVGRSLVYWADDGLRGAEPWVTELPPAVVGRHVFYNNSAFDNADPAATPADDAAVATNKRALLPGGAPASFANVTSYSRGINGVMIDVSGLPAGATPAADDFTFRTGAGTTWRDAPAPASITVRRGAGAGGSDRITLIWNDGAIRNTWLQVIVKATERTGLAAPDVFSFGNLVGDTGGRGASGAVASVDALDLLRTRRAASPTASITNPHDHNRDGRVSPADYAIARSNLDRLLSVFAAPVPAAGAHRAEEEPAVASDVLA